MKGAIFAWWVWASDAFFRGAAHFSIDACLALKSSLVEGVKDKVASVYEVLTGRGSKEKGYPRQT